MRAAWLDARLDAEGVRPLLSPLADAQLVVRPASPLVGSVRNEGASLLAA
jgi:putative SOS response-associated peptidase YedK